MKRIGILTILLIFLCSVQPAWANTEEGVAAGKEKHDVFDIYDLSGELYVWKGTALPLLPGVLLTSAANLPAETEHIGLSDGNGMWEARAVLPLFQGRTAFILFDAETEPPAVTPWPLMVSRSPTAARDIYVYHVTGAGDRIYRSVSGISPQGPEDADGMVLMLKAEAAPGDPILTDGGELAGMITAEYAEGEYRYSAVSAQGILNLLAQLYSLNENDGFTSCPDEGFEVTREENRVTFDWSGVQKETEEGQRLWLVIQDTGNDYFNYLPADEETRNCTMLLTPGRTYLSGLVVSPEKPVTLPDRFAVTTLPEAEKLTAHAFSAVKTGLILAEGAESISAPMEKTTAEITPEDLQSGKVHFYSWTTYTVAEKAEETLLISLTGPDGMNYRYGSGWIFDPAYMAEDIWSLPLGTMGFIEALERKGFPPGSYRMTFYVGGKEADSFAFLLKGSD